MITHLRRALGTILMALAGLKASLPDADHPPAAHPC